LSNELATALAKVLEPVLGDGVTIENLHALTGGASRTTWAFDAVGDGRRALILRTGPPDDVHAGMELEARVQQRAAAAGAPVPHILTADNSVAALGNPYLICDSIGGETIVRRIQRDLDDSSRAIAVFYWERKRALLVGASHALPLASADLPIEYETLGAPADPAEQRTHHCLARLRPRQWRSPQLDRSFPGVPDGPGHAGLAGRPARHHLTSRAAGPLRIELP